MRMTFRTAAIAVAILCACPARAAADAGVPLGPVYEFLQPYIVAVLQVVLPMLLGWLCVLLKQHLGLSIDRDTQEKIAAAAASAAGRIMASQSARFATMAISVNHPMIEKEVDAVVGALGQIAPSPAAVGRLIQGEIGKLQAQASAIPPALPIAALPGKAS